MLEIKGQYTTAKIMIDDVEEECLKQIHSMVNHVAFDGNIVVMPDTHSGKGSVIGFTMPLGLKVVPNVVGVDIGCGMHSVNVGDQVSLNKDKLLKIDEKIRNVVPMGNNIQKRSSVPSHYFLKNFPWKDATEVARQFIIKYNAKFGTSYNFVTYDYDWFLNKCELIGMNQDAEMGIGTLGGGNHFIEFGVSENSGDVWITVHSGSRNFGKMICEFHQKKAKSIIDNKQKNLMQSKIKEIKETSDGRDIPAKIKQARKELGIDFDFNVHGMEFLEGQDAIDYFMDMIFAQKYADFNRKRMLELICKALGLETKDEISCIHNFINFDDMVIRKGAISSYEGDRMIIPFSMSDGLLICEGRSNSEWNNSAPHGAGRLMSRGEASRNIDLKDFERKMKGIVSTSVCKSTLDEAPQAYKNPKVIEKAIEPTAKILDRVKPILNLKDKGESMTWKEKKEKIKREKAEQKNRKTMRRMKNKLY